MCDCICLYVGIWHVDFILNVKHWSDHNCLRTWPLILNSTTIYSYISVKFHDCMKLNVGQERKIWGRHPLTFVPLLDHNLTSINELCLYFDLSCTPAYFMTVSCTTLPLWRWQKSVHRQNTHVFRHKHTWQNTQKCFCVTVITATKVHFSWSQKEDNIYRCFSDT